MLKGNLGKWALCLSVFFSVWLCSIQALAGVEYVLDIATEDFHLEEEGKYIKLSLKGGAERNRPGYPSVPQRLVKLILPPDEKIKSVK
ncbi:hypothetical protein GTO10_06510, partial [Candidatus Saccharibacteria bacterium]|nr:hypothetical protein [Candidatus Saccharibacteria bacterium]